ncbi:MAG: response regulator, partial [Gammaproteobacteria bacterium]|nr:response regulator [Gammaproteobacteria bacterium]
MFKAACQAMPVGMLLVKLVEADNIEIQVVWSNPASKRLLNLAPEQPVTWAERPDTWPTARQLVHMVNRNVVRALDEHFAGEAKHALTMVPDRSKRSAALILTDKTYLTDEAKAAEEQSRAKSEFLRYMSNKLRTPANGIQGSLELVLKEHKQSGCLSLSVYDSTQTALECSRAFVGLLDELNESSSATTAAQPTLYEGQFDLYDVCYNVVKVYEASCTKFIKFYLTFPPNMGRFVWGDRKRVREILSSLVDNACKFTEEGSVKVRVLLDEEAKQVRVQVVDTGVGLDMADQKVKTLFARYNRPAGASGGLGLRVSARLANLIGGSLEVDSAGLDRGSTFTLSFPYLGMDGKEAAAEAEATAARPDQFNMRIMVADDIDTSQRVISQMLQYFGNEILIVDQGEKAVTMWRAAHERGEPFDCIFMDRAMPPGMDGEAATKLIRSIEAENSWIRTPIIGCSATVMELNNSCLESGMDEYVVKPISMESI